MEGYLDHLDSLRQMFSFAGSLLRPQTLRVTHRLSSINGLRDLADSYDLILLDRDCTLQSYHAPIREPGFEETLRAIAAKCELTPNASLSSFRDAGRVFSDLFPVSHLVRFKKSPSLLHLLRIENHTLSVWEISSAGVIRNVTATHVTETGALTDVITHHIKKPDPLFPKTVIALNRFLGRIPKTEPRVLFCGDRYLSDIAAGNLAGTDTALVRPVKPFSHPPILFFLRYLLDKPLGGILSRLP